MNNNNNNSSIGGPSSPYVTIPASTTSITNRNYWGWPNTSTTTTTSSGSTRPVLSSHFTLEHCHPELRNMNRFITSVSIMIETEDQFGFIHEKDNTLECIIKITDTGFDLSYIKNITNVEITRHDILVLNLINHGDPMGNMYGSYSPSASEGFHKMILIDDYFCTTIASEPSHHAYDVLTFKSVLHFNDYQVVDMKPNSK